MRSISKIIGLNHIYVLDIDNTLTVSRLNNPVDHHDPKPRKAMIDFVKSIIDKKGKIIFLSARDFRLFDITRKWLANQEIYTEGKQQLFLVKSSLSKIEYLQRLNDQNKKVTFVDDLSYNHENGVVKYYDDTKKLILALNIDFKGIDFINNISNNSLVK